MEILKPVQLKSGPTNHTRAAVSWRPQQVAVAILITAILCGEDGLAEEKNIAVGKPYSLVPEPNYDLCSDSDDPRQLTDGSVVGSSVSQIWLSRECVGWKTVEPVEIVIDLQEVSTISGLEVSPPAQLRQPRSMCRTFWLP